MKFNLLFKLLIIYQYFATIMPSHVINKRLRCLVLIKFKIENYRSTLRELWSRHNESNIKCKSFKNIYNGHIASISNFINIFSKLSYIIILLLNVICYHLEDSLWALCILWFLKHLFLLQVVNYIFQFRQCYFYNLNSGKTCENYVQNFRLYITFLTLFSRIIDYCSFNGLILRTCLNVFI